MLFTLNLVLIAKYGDSLKDQKVKKGTRSFGKPGKRGKFFTSLSFYLALFPLQTLSDFFQEQVLYISC